MAIQTQGATRESDLISLSPSLSHLDLDSWPKPESPLTWLWQEESFVVARPSSLLPLEPPRGWNEVQVSGIASQVHV